MSYSTGTAFLWALLFVTVLIMLGCAPPPPPEPRTDWGPLSIAIGKVMRKEPLR